MVVTILPWVVRNQLVLGHPIPFKDGFWLEVCVGNVNNSRHWWDGQEHPSGSAQESAQFERFGELRYMAAKHQEAMTYIQRHPGAYALRSLRHVVFMWTGFWSFNREYLREEPFDPENICFLSLLSLLSVSRPVPNVSPGFLNHRHALSAGAACVSNSLLFEPSRSWIPSPRRPSACDSRLFDSCAKVTAKPDGGSCERGDWGTGIGLSKCIAVPESRLGIILYQALPTAGSSWSRRGGRCASERVMRLKW